MAALRNIGLWFASLLLSVSLFSLLLSAQWFLLIFRITMLLALPVALLYLPVVVKLRDAPEGRWWKILVSGTLIGPACTLLFGYLQHWFTGWPLDGNGPAPGLSWMVMMALIVGSITTVFYVTALKIVRWRDRAAH